VAYGAPPRMKIGLSMIFRVYQAIFKGVSSVAMSLVMGQKTRRFSLLGQLAFEKNGSLLLGKVTSQDHFTAM
jgi:hypothetical protein